MILHLFSFSVKEAGWKKFFLLSTFAVFVFMAPVGYLTWWFLGGGHETEIRHRIEQLAPRDPAQDARDAVAARDYRLYLTGDPMDLVTPGCREIRNPWMDVFGGKPFEIYTGKDLTQEQKTLNASALAYLTAYNKAVREAVETMQPDWRRKAAGP